MTDETTAAPSGKQTIKIQGVDFEVPAPYVAGHVLNQNEASTLNQTFAENIRNNAAGRIKSAKEAAEKDGKTFDLDAINGIAGTEGEGKTLRQVIDEYAATYVFGARVARTSEPVDPVEREAYRIAKDTIGEALRAKGIKQKDLPEGQYDAAVKAFAAKPDTIKEAKRRVDARAKIGSQELNLLSDLGLDGGEAPAEATEPAAG